MPDQQIFDPLPVELMPDPTRTMIRPFLPEDPTGFEQQVPRPQRIAERVAALSDAQVAALCEAMEEPLAARAANPEEVLLDRYRAACRRFDLPATDRARQVVIGGYFAQEYAFESAALFNPSIVRHHDQGGTAPDEARITLSLRGIGEGHISSVTFRTGLWRPGGPLTIDPADRRAVTPRIEEEDGDTIHFSWPPETDASAAVLFPATPSQRQGIEDMRMTTFTDDDGSVRHFATYTAFSGSDARSEMLEMTHLDRFTLRPLTGRCVQNKGMALFPRRIDGRFAMIGRLDNENIWLMYSDDPYRWDKAEIIVRPAFAWDLVQMGNCGSPIELDEGWLLLTHGVGMIRSYSMGAVLLDKADPSKVLARTAEPLLSPSPEESGGYVPNVVYSCGALVEDRTMLLPYAVADRYTAFGTAPVERILAAMG
ncbi:MAG: glycoside hydrolase family 130 protein [Sphingomonas fennica]